MFEPLLTFGALFHLLALVGGIVFVYRKCELPLRELPYALCLLLWVNLVLTGHAASLMQSLNRLEVYTPLSLIIMVALLALFYFFARMQPARVLTTAPVLDFSAIAHKRSRKYLGWFLVITLALMAAASFTIALSVYPDNADSMIYRLPRAFWYVSNGSFLHPFESIDKRITYYPLDGVALYVPLVLYNLPGTVHNFPSVISWLMIGYTAYRFARSLNADKLIAFFAAWLILVTPSILAQSVSTNDEILAAVALLMGLFMGWRWLLSGRHIYLLLATTSVALSVGTKLHIVFLSPIILAAFVMALWHGWKKPELLREWGRAIGWKTGLVSLVSMFVMIVPFLLYNYFSTGRFYFFDEFSHDVFNMGASIRGSLQNLLIYTSQMMISPIADLNSWPVADDRQRFNSMLNNIFNPILQPLIDTNPAYYHFNYRFVGVTLPTSVRFVEFSLWSGFVWLLWPLQGWLAWRQKFSLRALFFLIAMTPLLWLLLWSFSTLYMEGTATYFAYYLICAAPASVFVFASIRRAAWHELRWVAIFFVAITSLIISTNMFMFSGFRALPDLVYGRSWPFDWDMADQPIIDEIRKADHVRIIATHEKMPYFAFMHWHPNATYYSPHPMKDIDHPEKVLQLLPTPSDYLYGFMPLKVPGKLTPGLTYLGTFRGIGREVIFAVGNNVHERFPAESDYLLPHMSVKLAKDGYEIVSDSALAGLNADDNLEFSYVLKQSGKILRETKWDHNPFFSTITPVNPHEYLHELTLKVRSGWSHKVLAEATYQLVGPGAWLPSGGEY